MSIQEARRAAFEKWVSGRKVVKKYGAALNMNSDQTQYLDYRVNDRWQAWNAALDSVVVELNSHLCYDQPGEAYQAIQDCAEAIEAAGVKCK